MHWKQRITTFKYWRNMQSVTLSIQIHIERYRRHQSRWKAQFWRPNLESANQQKQLGKQTPRHTLWKAIASTCSNHSNIQVEAKSVSTNELWEQGSSNEYYMHRSKISAKSSILSKSSDSKRKHESKSTKRGMEKKPPFAFVIRRVIDIFFSDAIEHQCSERGEYACVKRKP